VGVTTVTSPFRWEHQLAAGPRHPVAQAQHLAQLASEYVQELPALRRRLQVAQAVLRRKRSDAARDRVRDATTDLDFCTVAISELHAWCSELRDVPPTELIGWRCPWRSEATVYRDPRPTSSWT
jgi:hypothetical protein